MPLDYSVCQISSDALGVVNVKDAMLGYHRSTLFQSPMIVGQMTLQSWDITFHYQYEP